MCAKKNMFSYADVYGTPYICAVNRTCEPTDFSGRQLRWLGKKSFTGRQHIRACGAVQGMNAPGNGDIEVAKEYHEETKHSQPRLEMSRHYLDWDNRPKPFKLYADMPSIPLPDSFALPVADALESVGGSGHEGSMAVLDLKALAQLLFFSGGITREMKFESGKFYMRAASATGALYPIELYIVCGEIGGLPAGVYHFCPGDFSLTLLRAGDFRTSLSEMASGDRAVASCPATIIFTSIAWRNAWKYRARSYRHWFWDSGVIAANLLASAFSARLQARIVMGFVDSEVNRLLLLEPGKEAAIALAPIGLPGGTAPPRLEVPAGSPPKVLPLSATETDYPEIWKLHEASGLQNAAEVKAWSAEKIVAMSKAMRAKSLEKSQSLGETILRRGSSRMFSQATIPLSSLMNILYASSRGVPLDFLGEGATTTSIYLVANVVDGLAPGNYFYDRTADSLKLLAEKKHAASRNLSEYLCLGQPLFGNASAVMFLMADLDAALARLGNRGYRASQFEAGVIAGKLYLAAYAQGIGASGSTFYDDAVTDAFSPHAENKSAMIAVGVGMAAYRAKPGKVLAAKLTRQQLESVR